MNRQSGESEKTASAENNQDKAPVMEAVRKATPEQIQRLLAFLTYPE